MMPVAKYIEENVIVAFDYANQDEIALLGEVIQSIVSVSFTPADPALVLNAPGAGGVATPLIVGTQVWVWAGGGTSYQTYQGNCLVLTNKGKTLKSQMPLQMLD